MEILTFDRMVRAHAARRPDHTALNDTAVALSYAEFEDRARQVARSLIADGVQAGDRVAYLGKNTLAFFEFFLGAVKIGAVIVPINWRLAVPELSEVIESAQPQKLLVEDEFAAVAEAAAPHVPRLVCQGAADTYSAWRDRSLASDVEPVPDWNWPILQMYTSGTTGRAKGVVLTHRNLFALRAAQTTLPSWYDWSTEDVGLIAMPVAHVSGTLWAVFTLQHGATGIVARDFVPSAILETMAAYRISRVVLVPQAMQLLLRDPRAQHTDFSRLRYINYAGAPMSVPLLEECIARFGCGFVQLYGMTETTGPIVVLAPEDHEPHNANRLRSVGRPLEGVELKIVDSAGEVLPTGAIGEVVTRSPANMDGYFGMPEATAQTLDRDGWLRTGDAGYLDADGYLFLKDRVKDMIISGGENIYPAEVENALIGHPSVAEVAVIGVPDERWGEAVRAVVVPSPGASQDDADLMAWAAGRIARYKLPKSIEWVEALPRNHTGKVLRRILRDQRRS
jgi:acyl-CoA synthetase (AMP-forming)/AMP-acid ligase II